MIPVEDLIHSLNERVIINCDVSCPPLLFCHRHDQRLFETILCTQFQLLQHFKEPMTASENGYAMLAYIIRIFNDSMFKQGCKN